MHHHGFSLGVEETAKDEKTQRKKHHPRERSKCMRPASRENKAALTLWFVADFQAWKIAHLAAETAAWVVLKLGCEQNAKGIFPLQVHASLTMPGVLLRAVRPE